MAINLTGQKIKDTYQEVLHVDGGVDGTKKPIYDGDGTELPIKVSTTAVTVGGDLDVTGKVGIGTSSPSDKLTVTNGDASVTGLKNVFLKLSGSQVYEKHVDFYHDNTLAFETFLDGTNNFIWRTRIGGLAERMRIDSSGNLGIGTSSPLSKLQVHIDTTGSTYATDNLVAINDTQDMAIGTGGGIKFGGVFTTGGAANPDMAFIKASKENATSGDFSYALAFGTRLATKNPREHMRIDSNGSLLLGTTTSSGSAILDVQSTTKGVRMPSMNTSQKNAIATPAAGLMVFDTTLSKLCVYTGAAWETITSV